MDLFLHATRIRFCVGPGVLCCAALCGRPQVEVGGSRKEEQLVSG